MAAAAEKSPPISAEDKAAIDKDAYDFIRELEVERIVRAFKLKWVVVMPFGVPLMLTLMGLPTQPLRRPRSSRRCDRKRCKEAV